MTLQILRRRVALLNPSYCPEAQAVFRKFTTQPTAYRKFLANRFILALKSAGLWTRIDVVYLFAAMTSQHGLINWKNPGTFTATLTNSPTFTTDRGFTGDDDGTPAYVDSGFNPTSAGGNFALNSATAAVRVLNAGTNRLIGSGDATNRLLLQNGGTSFVQLINNSGVDITQAAVTAAGLYQANRSAASGAGSSTLYKDGSLLGSGAVANTALVNGNVYAGFEGGSGGTFQFASLMVGGSFSATDAANYAAAELAYMQGVGAA